jgi:hypothetical protein
LAQGDLAVAAVALRQRISESYVSKLFESEESSFSEWVLGERLIRPPHADRPPPVAASLRGPSTLGLATYLTPTAHSAGALALRRPKFVPTPDIANHKRLQFDASRKTKAGNWLLFLRTHTELGEDATVPRPTKIQSIAVSQN